jgi:L-ascorbate metabolism protein UlaG (beta-lactamase superfamily)
MESTVEKSRLRTKTNGWHWACLLIAGMTVIPVLGIPGAVNFSGPTPSPGAIGTSANPGKGAALIRYLGHCGFAVQTQNHLLIFDYQERREGPQPKTRPAAPALSNGWINPHEIKDFKVRVFVSHAHEDHFDPIIFEWKKVIPDIVYFFGWKAADDPSCQYLIGPRAEVTSGGLEICTINSHHSGVPEVAYLVKVDGLVIYHNGDCQPNDPAAYSFLRTKADRIDIAFVMPVYGDNERYTDQNLDLFEKFRPRAVFPMHAEAGASRFFEFEKVYKVKSPGLDIIIPAKLGDRFVFRNGKIER